MIRDRHAVYALLIGVTLIGVGEAVRRWDRRVCQFANDTDL